MSVSLNPPFSRPMPSTRSGALDGVGRNVKPPQEILLVEDSVTDAQLAVRAFTRARVANALRVLSSGEAALDYLLGTGAWTKHGAVRPLLILLDLQLPKMSGMDFLRRIKGDQRTHDIPVVSLSFTRSAPAIVMCLQLGVADHLIKPVDFKALVEVTKKLKLSLTMERRRAALHARVGFAEKEPADRSGGSLRLESAVAGLKSARSRPRP